jgi:hypothetical protein
MRVRISGEAEFEDSEFERLLKDLREDQAALGIGSVYATEDKVLYISEIAIIKTPAH